MNTRRNTAHILEFSGHEGKRTSTVVWLLGGLLSLFAVGLSGQRRRERALAKRHAAKRDTETVPAYGGADVALGVIAIIVVAIVFAMIVLAIRAAASSLPLIVDEVLRRYAVG